MQRIVLGASSVLGKVMLLSPESSVFTNLKDDPELLNDTLVIFLAQKKKLAMNVLNRFAKSPINAELMENAFNVEQEAKELVKHVVSSNYLVFN